VLDEAIAHSVSTIIDHVVQGRFRREGEIDDVQMRNAFCLPAVHLRPHLTWT